MELPSRVAGHADPADGVPARRPNVGTDRVEGFICRGGPLIDAGRGRLGP
jgi:hypothetical protein